jgi:hypothetical protein
VASTSNRAAFAFPPPLRTVTPAHLTPRAVRRPQVYVAQVQLTRLSSTAGNTLLTVGAQSDTDGNVYLLQNAACCIANMPNLTVNGQHTLANGDGPALHILTPSLETRLNWNAFVAEGATVGGAAPVAVDVRGTAVAVVLNSGAEMVTAGPVPGTGPNIGGAPVAYLVVLPTVPARAPATGWAR